MSEDLEALDEAQPDVDGELEALLGFLKRERGFDFTGYKRASLGRRIARRMATAGVDGYGAYMDYLEVHPQEFEGLFNTILINVTSFFRDEQTWEYLRGEVVPALLSARPGPEQIRIWSAGCAGGPEAYSIAMAFAEELSGDEFRSRVKIYATDVDEEALAQARQAVYTERQVEAVPADLRRRYFEHVDGRFAFRPDLRRAVIFGRHDLVQDAPISRIDLLLCRNTLMYLNAETQSRVLESFAFALREHGYLVLGKSEVLLSRSRSFAPVDLRRRVFGKAPREPVGETTAVVADVLPLLGPGDLELFTQAFDTAPVAQVVVDRAGRLVRVNAQARALFGIGETAVGRPLQDLELSYRPVELRSRIDQAYSEHRAVFARDVEWRVGTEQRLIDAQVVPITATDGIVAGVSVTFADVTRYRRLQDELQISRHELETAYEELQSTVEELETTNEELQSTNEELETTNEELQSSNEELETMNEELQSTNDELEAINDELRRRGIEVGQLNHFLEAILTSLSSGVVVLDAELRVQVWNSRARDLWGLRSEEVAGEPFLALDIGLPVERLRPALQAVAFGTSEREETLLRARDRRGRLIDCVVTCLPVRDETVTPVGVIILSDSSEVAEDGA